MYEMVTGRVPFDGDSTVAVAIQHLQEEMVAPSAYAPDLPISLEKIILKATMKNPDRRYATIEDLLMDLKKALVSPNEDFVTMIDADEAGEDQNRLPLRSRSRSVRNWRTGTTKSLQRTTRKMRMTRRMRTMGRSIEAGEGDHDHGNRRCGHHHRAGCLSGGKLYGLVPFLAAETTRNRRKRPNRLR